MKDLQAVRARQDGDAPLSLFGLLRIGLSAIGLVLVLVGAVGCIQLFFAAYGFIKNPQEHGGLMDQWVALLGVQNAAVKIGDSIVPVAGPIAVSALFGAFLLILVILARLLSSGLALLRWVREDRAGPRPPPDGEKPEPSAAP